jgi:succinate dehydrogenase / fumarate reductase cytochrome b subunit
MHGPERPVSPHLQVYRWQITMLLSSLHRITGLLLSLGAVVLAVWLVALATGPEVYADAHALLSGIWFKVLAVGWTFCFFYHLCNGVRHLVWDVGLGFDPAQIRTSGWTVVVVTVLATVAFAYGALF